MGNLTRRECQMTAMLCVVHFVVARFFALFSRVLSLSIIFHSGPSVL